MMDGLAVSELCVSPARDIFVVYLTRVLHQPSSRLFSSLHCGSRDFIGMSGFMTCTAEVAASPLLEASFENLLLSSDVLLEIITAFRCQKVTDQQLFASMDEIAVELKKICNEMFRLDTEKYGFPHKREWSKIHKAWLQSKVTAEVKVKVDAVTRAHGQPIQFLSSDWASLVVQFKQRLRSKNASTTKP